MGIFEDLIGGGLIGGIGSLGTSLMNNLFQAEANRQTQVREDTAVQRRVADLKAAGLSPVLAAGSAAASSPVKASSIADPIAAGSNMMQQQGSVAVSAAEKVRIAADTRIRVAQAEQEEEKAASMKLAREAWQEHTMGGVDLTTDGKPRPVDAAHLLEDYNMPPEAQRYLSSILEGSAKGRGAVSAADEGEVMARMAEMDYRDMRKLGMGSSTWGAVLKVLQMAAGLGGTAMSAYGGRGRR